MNRPAYDLLREGVPYLEGQARGYPLRHNRSGQLRGCALGAIAIAAEGDPARARVSEDYRTASWVRYKQLVETSPLATQPCPGSDGTHGWWPWHWGRGCERPRRVGNQVEHLNDHHGWSFARIAEWLVREHSDWLIPVLPREEQLIVEDAVGAVEEILRASR